MLRTLTQAKFFTHRKAIWCSRFLHLHVVAERQQERLQRFPNILYGFRLAACLSGLGDGPLLPGNLPRDGKTGLFLVENLKRKPAKL